MKKGIVYILSALLIVSIVILVLIIFRRAQLRFDFNDNRGIVGRWYSFEIDGTQCLVTNNCGSSICFSTDDTNEIFVEWIPMTNTNAYYSVFVDNTKAMRRQL